MKLKTLCHNREDLSVGFCCRSALGLVRIVHPIPLPNGLGIGLPIGTRPRAPWEQTPPEPVLIPEAVSLFVRCMRDSYSMMSYLHHYGDVIKDAIASQITSSQLFTQPCIRAQIKENIKAPRHWPLCGEFTGDPVNSTYEWPVTR